MDTLDGSDENLQSHEATSSSGHSGKARTGNSRNIIGRLVRRWPRIVLLWMALSAPLIFFVDRQIEPTYESSSTLRFAPTAELFGPSAKPDPDGLRSYLETQLTLMVSDRVLNPAIANVSGLSGYPTRFPVIARSADPVAEIRKRLNLQIIPSTSMIRVSFVSPSASEAAEVVNAVVLAFQKQNQEYNRGTNGVLISNYTDYLESLTRDIKDKQKKMIELAEKIEQESTRTRADQGVKPRVEKGDLPRPTSSVDEVKMTFFQDELSSLTSMRDSVRRKLEQLQFESLKDGQSRVYLVDQATPSKTPENDPRIRYAVMLTLATLFVVLGFFLMLEARSNPATLSENP
jgi:hypothetical protein